MTTQAQKLIGEKEEGRSGKKNTVIHDLAAHDLALKLAAHNLRFELEDRRRPQHAVACVRQTDGTLLKSGTADNVYSFKCTLPSGFSFDSIVANSADFPNYGIVDMEIDAYNLQNGAGGSNADCLPMPLDIFSVEQFVQRALAPLVQEDGKLKTATDVTITVYAWVGGQPFHGLAFLGTISGRRCALRREITEADSHAPVALLWDLKREGLIHGRAMMKGLVTKVAPRFAAMMDRIAG
jgi:hypothetical protein